MNTPLADKIRPKTLADVVGQSHILGKGKPLERLITSNNIPNMIFYGPSGVGKTTVANIISAATGKRFHKLNGTSASTADIKAIIDEQNTIAATNGILLYLDEIQYLNKKQQQSLLEHIENGSITLIASTTENPYFYVYNAILSRCTVFEFKPVEPTELQIAIKRAYSTYGIDINDDIAAYIAQNCGGDVRKSLNTVELSILTADLSYDDEPVVTLEQVKELAQKSSMRYDRDGDQHYNILSAFQKSIRGSDENAALYYLALLLEAGDLISICRRLQVIACEDISLAYPQCIPIVKACCDMARELGIPEARIPLANAVIMLCISPKSNSAATAIDLALADIRQGKIGDVPKHLKDGHYNGAKDLGNSIGYKYPHNYDNHYVIQQYLPDCIKDVKYYKFGTNKYEQTAKKYMEFVQNNQKSSK